MSLSQAHHSQNSLLGQISLVLVGNADVLQVIQLLFLDVFDLDAFFLDLLAHLATFLQVVQTRLLLNLGVVADLDSIKRGGYRVATVSYNSKYCCCHVPIHAEGGYFYLTLQILTGSCLRGFSSARS